MHGGTCPVDNERFTMLVIVVASTGKHDLSIGIGSSEQDFDDDLLMMLVTVSVLIMENSVIED